MSDKQSAARLSTTFLPRAWDSFGCHLHALQGALLASFSTASVGFSRREHALNAYSLYYTVVLQAMTNKARFAEGWQTYSLSVQTLRNLCSLACHGVQSTQSGFEPRACQELPIEFYFGRLKSHYKGQPSIRDMLQAVCVESAKTRKQLSQCAAPEEVSHTIQDRRPLEDSELRDIAKQALAASLQYHACICADETPESLYDHFRRWYPSKGRNKRFGMVWP